MKDFSERNIKLMTQFAAEYPDLLLFGQPPVAQLPPAGKVPQAAVKLTWAHLVLIRKVKDLCARLWYMRQTIGHGWSRSILALADETAEATDDIEWTLEGKFLSLAGLLDCVKNLGEELAEFVRQGGGYGRDLACGQAEENEPHSRRDTEVDDGLYGFSSRYF